MAKGQGDPSNGGDATGWRRFYEFWSTLPGVLTGIAALLGAIAALLTATQVFGPDPPDPPTTTQSPPADAKHAPCSDGVDNDRDGKTDFPQDPGCTSAEDPAEKQ
jgi:hypothetical protein